MKFIVYNSNTGNVYHKGYTYFGYDPSDDPREWEHATYDNLDSAKRALRKMKKESIGWAVAAIGSVSFFAAM